MLFGLAASASGEEDGAARRHAALLAMTFEELLAVKVVTPSRLPEHPRRSPNAVSIYTSREIELFGARDLSEVLSKMPSIMPFEDRQVGRSRLAIRGDRPVVDSNHVLFLLDGTPLNRESYTGGIWTQSMLSTIPLKIIERIEVVRGPGSVLYGTNAFTGVVNIITKRAEQTAGDLSVGYGANDTTSVDLLTGMKVEKLEANVAFSFLNTDGVEIAARDTTGTLFRDDAEERNTGVMGTLRYGGLYTAFYYGQARQWALRGFSNEMAAGLVDNRKYFANLRYTQPLGEDWKVVGKASHVGGRTDLFAHRPDPAGPIPIEFKYETNDSLFELTLDGSPFDRAHLMLGSAVNYLTGSVPPPVSTVPDWSDVWWNLYAEASYEFWKLKLIGGFQYNKTEENSGDIVPRVGAVLSITDRWTAKVLYGEAFRSPYTAEKDFGAAGLQLVGNPDLGPETVRTVDVSVHYDAQTFQSSLTFYWSKQEDLIVRRRTGPSVITFENEATLKSYGVEFEAKKAFWDDWFASASYLFQTNRDGEGIDDFTLQPSHMLKAGIGWANDRFSVGFFDTFTSRYHDNVRHTPARVEVNPKSKALHDLSIKLTTKLNRVFNLWDSPDLSLEFLGTNLANQNRNQPVHPGEPLGQLNTLPANSGVRFDFYVRLQL
jgi:outer membrane cobalamin receptor